MKKLFITIAVFNITILLHGQNPAVKAMIDSLKYLQADTLDCSADLYWRIIAQGDKAIPFLIDKLTDITKTNIRFRCKSSTLNVGEVAYFALTEIADFPAFSVTHIQFDVFNIKRCWNFYDFLFNNANKRWYKTVVLSWYNKEKQNYKPERIALKNQSACQKVFGVTTYYKWKGKD